jgi:hypothetical protein
MNKLRRIEGDELIKFEHENAEWRAAQSARGARIEACQAADGHYWLLVVEEGNAHARCTSCPVELDDLVTDGASLFYAEIPVEIVVNTETSMATPDRNAETDVWIEAQVTSTT